MHFFYSLALTAGTLAVLPYFLVRSLGNRRILRHWRERLGRGKSGSPRSREPGPVWIHAASVGEVRVAALLINRLQETLPGFPPVVLTTTTPAGREVARGCLENRIQNLSYFPLDLVPFVRAALRRVRPRLFLSIETEIWPEFLRQCHRRGVHTGIVNGRISRKSYRWYRWIRPILSPSLSGMSLLCMQSEVHAGRIRSLGGPASRIRITGNIKYDFQPDAAALEPLRALVQNDRHGPLLVAGSTAPGEEKMILVAFRDLRQRFPDLRLILAPRQPDRFEAAARILEGSEFRTGRRSRLAESAGEPWEILLLDTLGELSDVYGLATAAFVGGSWVERGGQNLIEPAAWGVPVFFGPRVDNFRSIARELVESGGGFPVRGPAELRDDLTRLLETDGAHRRAADGARNCAARHRGAVDRTVGEIAKILNMRSNDEAGAPVIPFPDSGKSWNVLTPLSWPYGLAVRMRNRWFDSAPGHSRRATIPVISIGNLVAGGTGKTPVAIYLSEVLLREGWRPAIVSRGYGRRGGTRSLMWVRRRPEDSATDAADRFGDEPTLIADRLPKVPVVVCGDRLRGVDFAWKEFGSEIAVLDDGFQHRRIHRDLDLLLIDALNPFGNGQLLPAGRLREPVQEIHRADAVLLTRWDLCPDGDNLLHRIRRWVRPGTPLFRCRQRVVGLRSAADATRKSLNRLRNLPVLAFCGIGNPGSFEEELRRNSITLTGCLRFRDHRRYDRRDRTRILAAARKSGAQALVTTEKDLVRFSAGELPLPVYALEVVQEPMDEGGFLEFLRSALPSRPSVAGGSE